ncbi:MAG: D-aminoacyl-tRNA deacylase [Candidatus Izemoplasma sp.]|nr:D-aminoacyl-tRNA deacylase [Candidatus Izemoplasma sp.]
MRVIVQRVKKASCTVNDEIVSSINQGFLLLVGFTHSDTENTCAYLAKKIAKLRIFEDDHEKLNIALKDKSLPVLSISQFTVYADTKKGNRPSFVNAMKPDQAKILYTRFNTLLRKQGITVKEGVFGEHMDIALINDGPVTIIMEREET